MLCAHIRLALNVLNHGDKRVEPLLFSLRIKSENVVLLSEVRLFTDDVPVVFLVENCVGLLSPFAQPHAYLRDVLHRAAQKGRLQVLALPPKIKRFHHFVALCLPLFVISFLYNFGIALDPIFESVHSFKRGICQNRGDRGWRGIKVRDNSRLEQRKAFF